MGRPEISRQIMAMSMLGNGLCDAKRYEDALSVQEAELSTMRRLGNTERSILVVQTNLANTYDALGRREDALRMSRDVYSGHLRLDGEECRSTLLAATNYANSLCIVQRYAEAKSLLNKMIPVAQRVYGASNDQTFRMKGCYAHTLCKDPGATLDDVREAVETLEDTARTARRVLGGAHPTVEGIESCLRNARSVFRQCLDRELD